MPDIFLYASQPNVYTIVLSDPTTSHSGSSVSVTAAGNAASLSLGIITANAGINVNLSGNIIASASGKVLILSTKPKVNFGRSSIGSNAKRKRKIGTVTLS